MNQIKFRAWDTHQNKMITKFMIGSNTDPDSSEWTCPIVWTNNEWVNHDGLIILQFTGLQDKDGVDIYEGDILQPSSYLKSGFARCVVTFKKGMFCFEISKPFIASTSPLYRSLGRGKSACNQFTKIGTIHQNPELIK